MPQNQRQSTTASAVIVDGSSGNFPCAGQDAAMLTLDGRGMVCGCNQASEALLKFHRSELAGQHISMVIPQLAEFEMMQNDRINQSLKYLCRIGYKFLAVMQDDKHFVCELFFNLLDNRAESRLSLIIVPAD